MLVLMFVPYTRACTTTMKVQDEMKAAVLEDWVNEAGIDVGGVDVRQLSVETR